MYSRWIAALDSCARVRGVMKEAMVVEFVSCECRVMSGELGRFRFGSQYIVLEVRGQRSEVRGQRSDGVAWFC